MKTKQKFLAMAAIALTFTACSSDNDSSANNDGKEYPISLSVGIGDLSVVTRAEGTTQLTSGDLGLYIIKNEGKDLQGKYLCDNAKFTYSSGTQTSGWSCNNIYYWASDNASIEYIAYMPYKDSGLTKTSISATEYDYTIDWNVASDTDHDLIWQRATATNSDTHSVAITLGHACSKLTVNVSKLGSEIVSTDENSVTVSKIEINGMAATGTFKFTSAGEWSNQGVATTYAMKSATTTSGNIATFESILIPQTANASLSITLSNGAVYQLSLPTTQKFEKGKHYTITIQVGQDEVELGEITQTQWTEVTGGDLTAQ